VKLNWSPLALFNVVVVVVLASTLFSTFSLLIACIVKTRERFMGVGQVLTGAHRSPTRPEMQNLHTAMSILPLFWNL
jgi:hypothetical protein